MNTKLISDYHEAQLALDDLRCWNVLGWLIVVMLFIACIELRNESEQAASDAKDKIFILTKAVEQANYSLDVCRDTKGEAPMQPPINTVGGF